MRRALISACLAAGGLAIAVAADARPGIDLESDRPAIARPAERALPQAALLRRWTSVARCVIGRDRNGSLALSAESVSIAARIFRGTVRDLAREQWPAQPLANLQRFAVDTLERHLERKLVSARTLSRIGKDPV